MMVFHEAEQAAEIADFRRVCFFLRGKTAADNNAEIQEQEFVHAVASGKFGGLFHLHAGEDPFALLELFIGEGQAVVKAELLLKAGVVFEKDVVAGRIGKIAAFLFPCFFVENEVGDPEIPQIFISVGAADRDQKCIAFPDRIGTVFGDMRALSGTDDDDFIKIMMVPSVLVFPVMMKGTIDREVLRSQIEVPEEKTFFPDCHENLILFLLANICRFVENSRFSI